MIRKIEGIIHYLAEKPKALFLIDSLGAMLTVFFLFMVSGSWNEYFGMPIPILSCLSAIAACFCLYSAACLFFLKENQAPFIRAISISNLLYCLLTMGLAIAYYPLLTMTGMAYFLAETAIICGLACMELKVAAEIRSRTVTD
jgi:hypothetical protein